MKTLEFCRQEIDRIDLEMAQLFEQRLALVSEIAEIKSLMNVPILDEQRENRVLKRVRQAVKDPELKADFENIMRQIMSISRRRQKEILEGRTNHG